MAILNFPDSPVGGSVYVAPNGITYTYDASTTPGVWRATTTSALAVSPGSISGSTVVGSTLTYTPGTATGGTPPYAYTQVWKANGTPIAGATGLTYTTVAGDAGKVITVTITATDSATPAATASATTAGVTVGSALSVTAGSISAGTPTVGTALTYTPGTASGGTSPYTYAYVWKANGTAIAGATGLTYTPVAGDVGKTLTVTITATDSASATANATTAPTSAVVNGVIPTSTYNPSPSTGPAASNTVATGTWLGTADTLTSTGCIEFQVNAGAYSQGPTAVATNDTVNMRWKSGVSCTGAADATSITGTLVAASGGTNSYTFVVDTTPTNFSFTDLSSQALSTAVTSNTITIAGPNVETYLTTTGGTLTSIQASIGGGSFAAIPASGSTMPVQPGQTIQIKGTTGGTASTGYTAILSLGGVSTTWTATTSAATASISTPSITSPANGATNLKPTITLQGSTYTANNGAGAQTSSTWEVYKANLVQPETSAIVTAASSTQQNWTASLSAAACVSGFGQPAANAFDGNIATVCTGANNGCTLVFSGVSISVTSSLKIYRSNANPNNTYKVNGGGATNFPNNTWVNTGFTGTLTQLDVIGGAGDNPGLSAIEVDGVILISNGVNITLTLTNNTNLSLMSAGDTVVEVGGGADASGVIASVSTGTNTIVLATNSSTGTWNTGSTVKDNTASAVTPPAPTTDPPNATNYTAITGSPFSVTTGTLTNLTVPSASITTSSTYYARTKYATTNATAATSSFSGWSSFATASSFLVSGWNNTNADGVQAVATNGTVLVAAGYGAGMSNTTPAIWTSTDGSTWTSRTIPTGWSGWVNSGGLATNGSGKWVIAGSVAGAGTAPVSYSSDNGVTWTNAAGVSLDSTGSQSISAVTWNPNASLFMAIGGVQKTPYTSPDGVTWTARGSTGLSVGANSDVWPYLVYVGSTWYLGGTDGQVAKSTNNGVSWTTVTTPFTGASSRYGILSSDGTNLYYFHDSSNKSYKSSDGGATWTQLAADPSSITGNSGARGTAYTPSSSNFIVTGPNGIAQSMDGGATWVDIKGTNSSPQNVIVTQATFNGNYFAWFRTPNLLEVSN